MDIVLFIGLLLAWVLVIVAALSLLYSDGHLGDPQRRRQQQRQRYLALHEAGHAVIAWQLPAVAQVKLATIVRDPERTESAGRVEVRFVPHTPEPPFSQQALILLLAGMASEAAYGKWGVRGSHARDVQESCQRLAWLAGYLGHTQSTIVEHTWGMVQSLVSQHRCDILRVAQALMRHRTLDTVALERILGPRPTHTPSA